MSRLIGGRGNSLSSLTVAEIVRRYRTNESVKSICQSLHISRATVLKYVRLDGSPIRRPGGIPGKRRLTDEEWKAKIEDERIKEAWNEE